MAFFGQLGTNISAFWQNFWAMLRNLCSTCRCGHFMKSHFFEEMVCFSWFLDMKQKKTQISFETLHEGCHNCILRLHRCFFRKIEVFKSWFFHRFWISDYFFWALAKKSSGGDDETAFKLSLGTFWWKVIGLAFFSHREQKNQLVEKLFWQVCQNCIIRVRGVILGEHVCFETKFVFQLFSDVWKNFRPQGKNYPVALSKIHSTCP